MTSSLRLIGLVLQALVVGSQFADQFHNDQNDEGSQDRCSVCKLLVESFKKGVDRTARGKFEGGDSHWEEKKLGSYADSEIRLVEIEEKLCHELKSSAKDQCHSMAEEAESHLENWWFSIRKQPSADLTRFLCIDQLSACCHPNHAGPDCHPCPGYPDAICAGRGWCEGNGTRDGSGKCRCWDEYAGELCHKCNTGYYQSDSSQEDPELELDSEQYKEEQENGLRCEKCDSACSSDCRGPGPKNCLACRSGYFWDNDDGCLDVDECLVVDEKASKELCPPNSFCINTLGSYQCYDCDRACDGCHGDGPDTCLKCAEGYDMEEGVCLDRQAKAADRRASFARYATYLGMCLATCIILRNNIAIASVIGILVALYIGLAEWTSKDGGDGGGGGFDLGKLFI